MDIEYYDPRVNGQDVHTCLQAVAEAAPDVVSQRLGLLRKLEDAHASIGLALFADSEPINVDPRSIGAVKSGGYGCQIVRVTCKQSPSHHRDTFHIRCTHKRPTLDDLDTFLTQRQGMLTLRVASESTDGVRRWRAIFTAGKQAVDDMAALGTGRSKYEYELRHLRCCRFLPITT